MGRTMDRGLESSTGKLKFSSLDTKSGLPGRLARAGRETRWATLLVLGGEIAQNGK